jgi:hypothetical protein
MCMLIALCPLRGGSSQAHELVLSFLMGYRLTCLCYELCFSVDLREVLSQPLEARRSPWSPRASGIMPQGPGEGTLALSECETFGPGVQMRPATRCCAARVGYDEPGSLSQVLGLRVRPCDHPQQLTLGGSYPTTDTGPDWSVAAGRAVEL